MAKLEVKIYSMTKVEEKVLFRYQIRSKRISSMTKLDVKDNLP